MERKAPVVDRYFMTSRTSAAKSRVNEVIQQARDIEADAKKEDRLKKHVCKACFYFARIAGAAMTSQPCACCAEMQTYGSTSTDVLCQPCAKEHGLCKHCGGDLELRVDRRSWPEMPR